MKVAGKLLSLNWFTYFFIGFLVIALTVSFTGVTITYFKEYTFLPDTPYESNETWFTINRLNHSFWDTFNILNNTYKNFIINIPSITLIPYYSTDSFYLVILNAFIFFVNGFFTIVNAISTVVNTGLKLITGLLSVVQAFGIWVASAGHQVIPR